ncbi:MAG: hypothetical protein MK212_19210 [Saprospiraceae bacterium]|nr:hypothetical protein [Saprospiraceae bacterium]
MLRHCVHILGVYLLLLTLSIACRPCNNVQLYYDFATISWQSQQDSVGSNNSDSCLLTLYLEQSSFIGQLSSPHSSFFINTAYAYSCAPDGSRGLYNKITAIHIRSDQDFNASYLAGADLSNLIEFAYWDTFNSNRSDGYVFEPLSNASLYKINQQQANMNYPFYFLIKEKPDLSSELQFTIELEREDGTIHQATSSTIIWK